MIHMFNFREPVERRDNNRVRRRNNDNTGLEEQIVITQGEKICNGAVTKEIGSTTLQICVNGKVTHELTITFL